MSHIGDPPPGRWHPRAAMVAVGRHPVRSRATADRPAGFRIWYRVLRCPTCGAEIRRMENATRGYRYRCSGDDIEPERIRS